MASHNLQKVDSRIRLMLENAIKENHRSFFVMVGKRGEDQVPIMHNILSKISIKARTKVLWCYKKELGFTTHRKRLMKIILKQRKSGKLDQSKSAFSQFVVGSEIRFCYYKETQKILGNTYGMCILQDFEALTPNTLARTVETVSGGGLIVILLKSLDSLKQLATMTMDVHARYRTELQEDIVCRFNERFLLSLESNPLCLVMDDRWNVLPFGVGAASVKALPSRPLSEEMTQKQKELKHLVQQLQSAGSPFHPLVALCVTLDQAKALEQFIRALVKRDHQSGTVVMTAARGRGKSVALGLGMAAAIEAGLTDVSVTAPGPENLGTLMEFLVRGLKALGYEEHIDFEQILSTEAEHNKAVVRIDITRQSQHQAVTYIRPWETDKLSQADLVCIDEAAAIPLLMMQAILDRQLPLVYLSTTVNGYEGTGRSLSQQLFSRLRAECGAVPRGQEEAGGRALYELTLEDPIRYGNDDPVERWLNDLLCLDCADRMKPALPLDQLPPPDQCQLYYVDRDVLFAYHKTSNKFLHHLMGIYVAANYKNSPDDLQLLSDAPSHHLFCLLPTLNPEDTRLPEVLSLVHVCMEGALNKEAVLRGLAQGRDYSMDRIPWIVTQQLCESKFGELSGCRVVRIATHPDYQGRGYGTRALDLLHSYFQGKGEQDGEKTTKKSTTSQQQVSVKGTLLHKLSQRPVEEISYFGVMNDMPARLFHFWKRAGYVPLHVELYPNDLTGEFKVTMLKQLPSTKADLSSHWLDSLYRDFRRVHFCDLLGGPFRPLEVGFAHEVMQCTQVELHLSQASIKAALTAHFSLLDLHQLVRYANGRGTRHEIAHILIEASRLHFSDKLSLDLSDEEERFLVGSCLQWKSEVELKVEEERSHSAVIHVDVKACARSIANKLVFLFTCLDVQPKLWRADYEEVLPIELRACDLKLKTTHAKQNCPPTKRTSSTDYPGQSKKKKLKSKAT